MRTEVISLIGDHKENFYQLGKKEASFFFEIEKRALSILSSNSILKFGQEIITKTKIYLKKDRPTFFDECVIAYAEGIGIEPTRYFTFIAIFEAAAHYGQIYPELKSLIPGCATVFEKNQNDYLSNRLIDFPIGNLTENSSRIYYFKFSGKPSLLNFSSAGMAPLIFHALHDSGHSASLHYKPSHQFHPDGESIFKIFFDLLHETPNMNEFRREIRKRISQTKWGFYLLNNDGHVLSLDIDGPSLNQESFNLNENSPLIFTNIPIHKDKNVHFSQIKYSQLREKWFVDKFKKKKNAHTLDILTQVSSEGLKSWPIPMASLASINAFQINLTKGKVHFKEGQAAITKSDPIYELSLADLEVKLLRPTDEIKPFEAAWKKASIAQALYDQGKKDDAFHYLQMGIAMSKGSPFSEILKFYFYVWEFKEISNRNELLQIYRELKILKIPEYFGDQYHFMLMRFEKRLKLSLTIDPTIISPSYKSLFQREIESSEAVFSTWMKLIYPRLDLFEIFSPHHH